MRSDVMAGAGDWACPRRARRLWATAALAATAFSLICPPGGAASGIHLVADGRDRVLPVSGGSVRDALRGAGIALGEHDQVTPALDAALHDGDTVRVVRVEVREVTVEESIPAPTVVRPPSEGRGPYHPTVAANGKPGLAHRTYRITLRDGVQAAKTLVSQQVLREPVPLVVTARSSYPLASRGGVYAGRRVFTMVATAYDPGPGSCPGTADGITCNGKRAGYGIAAVDPTVIPLGSKLYIEGYGYAIAADVGGAIKGMRIDLGYNSRSGALQWGRRTVTVYVID